METSVELQRFMRYSRTPMIIVGSLIAALTLLIIIYLIHRVIKLMKANRKVTIKEVVWTKPNMSNLKGEYLQKIKKIETEFTSDTTQIRPAYEKLSVTIRDFAYKASGVEVQKYTLSEIRATHLQDLANLIQEFYEPEFDKISEGDVMLAIDKTKRMIIEWN